MNNWIKPKFPPPAAKPVTRQEREVKAANEVIKAALKEESLILIEVKTSQGSHRSVKEPKPVTTGYGASFTADQLARVTIDSDLSRHAMKVLVVTKDDKKSKKGKKNS